MFAGLKVAGFCIFTIFVLTTSARHRNLNVFTKFLVPETLLRFRDVVVAKVKIVTCPALETKYSSSIKKDKIVPTTLLMFIFTLQENFAYIIIREPNVL